MYMGRTHMYMGRIHMLAHLRTNLPRCSVQVYSPAHCTALLCSTVQHKCIATQMYCNTNVLQHKCIATQMYCNTNVLQHKRVSVGVDNACVLQCAAVQFVAVCERTYLRTAPRRHCNTLQHTATHCNTLHLRTAPRRVGTEMCQHMCSARARCASEDHQRRQRIGRSRRIAFKFVECSISGATCWF